MPRPAPIAPSRGLAALRRGGALAELLFLYDCATEDATRLRPIADRLGVTVQAVSHAFRGLARRGLAEVRDGRYRPTVRGVAWLHALLGEVAEDGFLRQDRLHIIRSCRAVAGARLASGERVRLELVNGVLSAFPGSSRGSRGRAARGARAGELVEVRELEGILRMSPARIRVVTLPAASLGDPSLPERLARAVHAGGVGLIAAYGLEAYHILNSSDRRRPIVRFGVAAAAREASLVGLESTIVVLDEQLPGLLTQFPGPEASALKVELLNGIGSPRIRRRPKSTV